jgi:hypothetical protein
MLSNGRNPPRPVAKSAEQGNRITGSTGKSIADEKESAGVSNRKYGMLPLGKQQGARGYDLAE